jgi:hypothetical protein
MSRARLEIGQLDKPLHDVEQELRLAVELAKRCRVQYQAADSPTRTRWNQLFLDRIELDGVDIGIARLTAPLTAMGSILKPEIVCMIDSAGEVREPQFFRSAKNPQHPQPVFVGGGSNMDLMVAPAVKPCSLPSDGASP